MLRKALVVLGLAGVLTLSAGLALASTEPVVDDLDEGSTLMVPVGDRDLDQVRLEDSTSCGTCSRVDGGEYRVQEQVQRRDQVQDRDRIYDPDGCDGDGLQLREQVRAQAHAQTQVGPQASDQSNGGAFGEGPRDGTGPLHEGPADGTGQNGQRGR